MDTLTDPSESKMSFPTEEMQQTNTSTWDIRPPPGSPPGSPIPRPMSAASTSMLSDGDNPELLSRTRSMHRPQSQYAHQRMSTGIDTLLAGMSAYPEIPVQDTGNSMTQMRRPHLDRLDVAYYRLYWQPRTPLPSQQPLYPDDPSLSSFNIEHIPPPRLAGNYMAYICNREGIHMSRVKMYINARQRPDGQDEIQLVHPNDRIQRGQSTCGSSENNPYMLTVEMGSGDGGNGDREAAGRPVNIFVRGARWIGRGIKFCLGC
ncbi:hypothetical protein FRC02_001613 [Tulasnella sp. 418]|nr:hypothetical protein FRC02_001613 [Tulasnella sp. 418]